MLPPSLFLALLLPAFVTSTCYEPSFAHAPPTYDVSHPVLHDVFTQLHDELTILIANPAYNSTSFSVEITSSHQSLWSFHHTARERNASRPDTPKVNGDALYRIASVTKTFTVLALLQQHAAGNLSLDDTIDKYVAELRGPQNGSIPWKDITLRSLASQLSGIPREMAQSDLINAPWNIGHTLDEWGLPYVSRDGMIACDEYSADYSQPCTRSDLLRSVKQGRPVYAPNQQSTYSNVAFELLSLAIANVTNQTYESYIHDAIFEPLAMDTSTFSKPPDSAGVIPLWPHYYDVDEGVQNPTGGIYTSSKELSKFLRYILTHYNAITHAVNWMHPVSPSRDMHSFYGLPWEIFQTDRVLTNSRRTVRFVTKSGGLPGYSSLIVLVPQYDLAFTLLLAGPPDFFHSLMETTTVNMVRAAEELTVSELVDRYAGRFVAADPNLNSSIVLVADHRGLVVEQFISNSTDVLQSSLMQYLGRPRDLSWYMQLVPTQLYRDQSAQKGELWRMQVTAERPHGERDVWDDYCFTNTESMLYGGIPLNEVVFWKGSSGLVYDLELAGFRANLTRIFSHFSSSVHVEEQEAMEL